MKFHCLYIINETPIHAAVRIGNYKIVQLLMQTQKVNLNLNAISNNFLMSFQISLY